jgi:uncharacterized protein with HEPN domain
MPRSFVEPLSDALVYSESCQSLNAGKTYLGYANDKRLKLATERCLGVVGEALSQAVKIDPTLTLAIPDAVRMIGLRHRLVHAYYGTYDSIVWSVVHDHLPGLMQEVASLSSETMPPGEQVE